MAGTPIRAARGTRAQRLGRAAESAAAAALEAEGWTILGRRLRTQGGEIDLVVRKADILAFVEVKARPALADAAWAISLRQQGRLLVAAEILLGEHPEWHAPSMRFDAMLVDGEGRVRRIVDAFRADR